MKKFKVISLILIFIISALFFLPACADNDAEITFDYRNGDSSTIVKVKKHSLIENPPIPERRACTFDGWCLADGTKWDFEAQTVDSSITLYASWTLNENFYQINDNGAKRADNAELRIMSYNVLASDWGAKVPVSGRDEKVEAVLNRYLPDVIGLQEFNNDWYNAFENFENFTVVNSSNRLIDGSVNYSTIAYNSSTVNLISYEQFRYNSSDHKNCRNVLWALFSLSNDYDSQFIVINTHLGSEDSIVKQINELKDLISSLKQSYSLPIFVTGDFNMLEESTAFKSLIKNGTKNAKYSAIKRGLACYTYHMGDGTGSYEDRASGYWKLGAVSFTQDNVDFLYSIDHILTSGDLTTLYYDTIIDEDALDSSDHVPIYIDVTFS